MKFKFIYNKDSISRIYKIDSTDYFLNKDEYLFEGTAPEAIAFFEILNIDTKILQRLIVKK